MDDLVPPEAPGQYKRKSFLSKIFGKKKKSEEAKEKNDSDIIDNLKELKDKPDVLEQDKPSLEELENKGLPPPTPPPSAAVPKPEEDIDTIRAQLGMNKAKEESVEEKEPVKEEDSTIEIGDPDEAIKDEEPTVKEPELESISTEELKDAGSMMSEVLPESDVSWTDHDDQKEEQHDSDWLKHEEPEVKSEDSDWLEHKEPEVAQHDSDWLKHDDEKTPVEESSPWLDDANEKVEAKEEVETVSTPEEVEEPAEIKEEEKPKTLADINIEGLGGKFIKKDGRLEVETVKYKDEIQEEKEELDERMKTPEIEAPKEEPQVEQEEKKEIKAPEPKLKEGKPEVKEATEEKQPEVKLPEINLDEELDVTPPEMPVPAISETKADIESEIENKAKVMEERNLSLQEELDELLNKQPENKKEFTQLTNIKSKIEKLKQPLIPEISEENKFVMKGGKKVSNLKDLIKIFEKMNAEEFSHHVNNDKNDFADWIENTLNQKVLAKQLKNNTDKEKILGLLTTYDSRINKREENRQEQIKNLQKELKSLKKEIGVQTRHDLKKLISGKRPKSLKSVLKTLNLICDVYKIDLNTFIIKNKKEFSDWLKRYMEHQTLVENNKLETLKDDLKNSFDEWNEGYSKELAAILSQIKNEINVRNASSTKIDDAQRKLLDSTNAAIDSLIAQSKELKKEYQELESQAASRIEEASNKENEHLTKRTEFETQLKAFESERDAFLANKNSALKQLEEQKNTLTSELKQMEQEKQKVVGEQKNELEKLQEEKAKAIIEKEEVLKKLDEERERKSKEIEHAQNEIIKHKKEELAGIEEESNKKREHQWTEHKKAISEDKDNQLKEIEEQRKTFENYRKKETEDIEKQKEGIQQEKLAVERLKKELTDQEESVKKTIEEQKSQIKQDLEEIRRIDSNLAEVESNIKVQKQTLEQEGFQKYLESKLRNIRPNAPDQTEGEEEQLGKIVNKELFDLVEVCKSLVENGKIEEARDAYQDLKSKFENAALDEDTKASLYTTIRELYDDIHLEMLKTE